jgi:hypothetical protein
MKKHKTWAECPLRKEQEPLECWYQDRPYDRLYSIFILMFI